ncbi:MAG: helix-turn-helix domain-containing protein, partial [Campylobacter sp.]|nr:helix-turn-helix domain-containing protein [Campylobacter sp.]MBR0070701.1 helix-turn-helix domain-containing protein [Campylobacter sp.]
KELDLLALLLQKRGQFVSRDEIFNAIWSYDEIPSELSLRVYIRNLRLYLKDKIVSKSKVGYSYAD